MADEEHWLPALTKLTEPIKKLIDVRDGEVHVGRVTISDDSEDAAPRYEFYLHEQMGRFTTASVLGLVVGAAGLAGFGIYWYRWRRRMRKP